jgi:hypothetical protein
MISLKHKNKNIMSKNKSSISKIQKMMYHMHIDDETYASSQLVLPMVFENRSLNRSSHHHQQQKQQDCNRSCFFYKLRQKKKQRRLQHGPLHIRAHKQQHTQEQKRDTKLITAIVGDSIARNISVKTLESVTDEVRLRFKSGSDCADALAWLQSTDGQVFMRGIHQLIFIIGTNDLHRVGAFQTVQRIDHTIATVRHLYPGINIVWQLLQQRTRKTWLLPEGQSVLHEIEKCNMFLLELAAKRRFDTIQPAIPIRYMYDGLHPSKYGVEMMETAIRNHLQKIKIVYSSSYSTDFRSYQSKTSPQPLMSINF